ncbi:MAG: Gfo/Idh/MocA family protein [Planctomycetota bacterium]|jgi:predicted dehydrogenase
MAMNRRRFVKGTVVAAGAASLPLGMGSRVLGANDEIRVAVIGLRGKGKSHIAGIQSAKGARVVALCDVDPAVLDERAADFEKKYGYKVDKHMDVREVLDRQDIDAITTATPNHWHSLIGIWACQAGKDSYVEKPISHTVWEGRQLVNAARKYKKIVQGGTQSRSNEGVQKAIAYIHSGELGKIELIRGLCFKPRQSIGATGKGQIPTGLDYDLWIGPAKMEPLKRTRLHYDWHWVYNTGNGDMGNQGIHQMDVARWALGVNTVSPRVMSVGARVGYVDDGETPNSQVVIHDYDKAPLVFETRGLPKSKKYHADGWNDNMNSPHGFEGERGVGVIVQCEHGKVVITSGRENRVYDNDGKMVKGFSGPTNEFQNFVDVIRSRKRSQLNAESLETHLSSALCHTGLISHKLGELTSHEEIRETLKSNAVASERYGDLADHLGKNGVDIKTPALALGPWLEMNVKTERFTNNKKANRLLHRRDRAPFIVPEITA